MDQEKFGKFIKEIRKKNNLTQKQLADKYNVTYQAVSKWENGKNMPDTSLIKLISKDFNISLEEMFEGELKEKRKDKKNDKKILFLLIFIVFILIFICIFLILKKDNGNFEFKTLSSTCEKFDVSGNIAYNEQKSSIYVTNIKYCDENDKEKYQEIECVLYESNNDIEKKISSCKYSENEKITIEEFLETVTLTVDDYKKMCKNYSKESLYLSINAKNIDGKITTYKIPLSIEDNCYN